MTTELAVSEDQQQAILRYLKLDPQRVETQALLLIAKRYGLDPLLRHLLLIDARPYITRDGLLHVAHESGQFDGLEVLEEGVDDDVWWAKVACHRRDMSHPFTYRGRYPKAGQNKKYGPEMAVKCAEVMALRRAFDVTGIATVEEQWDVGDDTPPADEAPCPKCGEIVPGARSDREPMRQHMVTVHLYVRNEDGTVQPHPTLPEDPDATSPASDGAEASAPSAPSSQAPGASTEHQPSDGLAPSSSSPARPEPVLAAADVVLRLETRIQNLADYQRDAVWLKLAENGIDMKRLLTDEVSEVGAYIDECSKLERPGDETNPAAQRALRMAAKAGAR